MQWRFLHFLLCSLVFVSLTAQRDKLIPTRMAFDPQLTYQEGIPTPASFLGYELGEEFTVYAQAAAYFQTLAEASDRVLLRQYGKTYQRRPLYSLVISSPANLARIEEISQTQRRMASNPTSREATQAAEKQPVVVSYSYNIHGNEASGTEAAMQVAYRLAAATDPATSFILDNTVIILYVCVNPDGRDRYVYWYNGMRRAIGGEEPRDLEHYDPWPNGRSNHYWFDLNRDWIWGIHPETRGLTAEYQRWMPQVHVDYHEQGYDANYFTVPGATPRNQLLPVAYESWADTFGRANIAAFDSHAISYFTRDRFDFFYPGYGSSYPSVMGAVGMLTEQGGIDAGRAVVTNDGYVLTLRQRIFDHYLTSLATLYKSAQQRRALLDYSLSAWNPANSRETTQTYVLAPDPQGYIEDVLAMLLRQGVQVEQTTAPLRLPNAMDYRTGLSASRSFPAGVYVIRANQPRHLFLHSVLARNLAIEDSVMYDMATWSAPLAYNLEAYASPERAAVATVPVVEVNMHQGKLDTVPQPYAYVIDWRQRWAPKALAMLWERGYRVRSAIEPFNDGVRDYSAGSLIVLRGANLELAHSLETDMAEIANLARVTIQGMPSGRMLSGYDLASARNQPLHQPRVALLVEPPFDTYTAGQVYFLFDQETQLPVERIRASTLLQTALPKFGQRYGLADLNDYQVLILPGASPKNLAEVFGKEQREQLNDWLKRGGVLIAMEESTGFFTSQANYNTINVAELPKDTSLSARYLPYDQRERYAGLRRVPGSAFNGAIDNSHPLGFGLPPQIYSLCFGDNALLPDNQLHTVGYYEPDFNRLLVAGYASLPNQQRLAGKAFAAILPVEKGKIVYLVDNPHFRMFWRGPSRLMQNAVMVLPGF